MSARPFLWLCLRRRFDLAMADRAEAKIQRQAIQVADRISETSRAISDLRRDAERGRNPDDVIRAIDWLHTENEAYRERLRNLSTQAVHVRATKLRLALSPQIPPRDAADTTWPVGLTD